MTPARPLAGQQVQPPRLRPARFDDYPAIAALQEANGLVPKPREEWEHSWTANPAMCDVPGWTMGWVQEDEAGRIVGSIGSIPFTYYLRGRKYICATGCGWAVDPAYRGFSIPLIWSQMQQPGLDLHIATTPGPAVAIVFPRIGFTRVPVGQWDRAAVWATGSLGLTGSRPREGAWPSRKLKTGTELSWRCDFDSQFDEFWQELQARNPNLLLSCRAKAVLDWHFKHGIRKDRIRIVKAHQGRRLVAYAVLDRRDTRRFNLRRMLLIDYQELEPGGGLCPAILAFAIRCCRREGVQLLENPGCWIEQPGLLNRTAPFHRSLKSWTYFYRAPAPALADALQDPACWRPTQYDGDASL